MSKTVASLAVPLVVFLILGVPLWDGFTDDGYIHIQYAKNIVTRGEYSFNPGEVSFGTTSPLWVIIQAALGRLLGTGEVLVTTSQILSWVSGFLAVLGMFVLARTLGLSLWSAWICALVFASHTWFVRWSALGMETSAAVLAIIGVGIASVRAFNDHRSAWLLGFAMAVAALMRPESYLIVPVYLVAVAAARIERRGTIDLSCTARTLGIYAALIVPWLVFAQIHIGNMVPNTAGAKSGGLILDPMLFLKKFLPIVKIVGSSEGIPALIAFLSLVIFGRRARIVSATHRFLLFWVVALPVAYVIFDIQVLSRYMLLVTPFTVVLGFSALEQTIDKFGGRYSKPALRRWIPGLAAAAAMLVNVVFYVTVVIPPSRAFSYDLTHNLKDLALHIKDSSPEDAVVAAADIGYLSFYSERWVLDLGGLVDTETHKLREAHTYEEIVDRGLFLGLPKYPRVDFFIDRDLEAHRFDGQVINGYLFEPVLVKTVRNLGIRKPGPYYYTLYRLIPLGNQDD
ncbi:MAG: hypothetical protein JSW50_13370 [Candidatus Latescibacterota bacterium]|nr:MAG: hypothetical protein JSW50_13370 [Candidatus Latescibacterota bacterium]